MNKNTTKHMGLFSKIFIKPSDVVSTLPPPERQDTRTPFQIEITRICNELAQIACRQQDMIVVPNELKNKDKLALVVTVQTPRCMPRSQALEQFCRVKYEFESEFNDGTVLIIMVPMTDGTNTLKVDVKQLNTSKMSPEQLDKVLLRADEVIEKFVKGLK